MSATNADSYTAHATAIPAAQSNEVYLTLCTAVPSLSATSASDKRYSLGVMYPPHRIPLERNPTPEEAGRLIGVAIGHLPFDDLTVAHNVDVYEAAGCTRNTLINELVLLCSAAAAQAIVTARLGAKVQVRVLSGLTSWLHERVPSTNADLLALASEYAAAAREDEQSPPSLAELSALEAVLGERLFALGPETDTRAQACTRLCIATPKSLWPVQVASTQRMLAQAQFVEGSRRDA